MTDYIEFNNDEIVRVAQATQGSQAEWDRIWNDVKGKLGRTVSEALDALTGSSLEERSLEYHNKTTQYTQQLLNQTKAVQNVGNIATETNQQMTRIIRG